jgi:hypothetical protein
MNALLHAGLLVAALAVVTLRPYFWRRTEKSPSTSIRGIPCDFAQQRVSRSNQVTVTVSMPCDERFEFTLRRERLLDRFAKALHMVREFQTADERFDEGVYVGADERGFDEWLRQDATARQEFLDLLGLTPQQDTRVTGISASRGVITLSALAKPAMFTSAPDELARTVADASVPRLKSCIDHLQAFASTQADPDAFRDPYAGAIRSLTALTAAIIPLTALPLIFRVFETPRIEFADNPFADRTVYFVMAYVLGALTVLTILLLRGSVRLHTVLLPLLFCAAVGTVIAAPEFIREVNTEWDQSTPHRYSTSVVYRYVTHGKHNTYYLWLVDWHRDGEHQELRVDPTIYNELQEGDWVTVTERAGYLGRPWISNLTRGALPGNDE